LSQSGVAGCLACNRPCTGTAVRACNRPCTGTAAASGCSQLGVASTYAWPDMAAAVAAGHRTCHPCGRALLSSGGHAICWFGETRPTPGCGMLAVAPGGTQFAAHGARCAGSSQRTSSSACTTGAVPTAQGWLQEAGIAEDVVGWRSYLLFSLLVLVYTHPFSWRVSRCCSHGLWSWSHSW
jgi:hypothetical protein